MKRKVRRRPSWGRGIIRKRKNYKKGTEEEEDEHEVEVAGPSDSCLTQDEESSCDTTGSQPNGHHPHAPSTEEESSNEPPVAAPAEPPDASEATEEPAPKEDGESTAKQGESENTEKHNELHCLGGGSHPKVDKDSEAKQADFQPLIEMSESSDAEAQTKHTEGLVSVVECVNGNESMDSLDSQSLSAGCEAEKRTPQSMAEGSNKPEQEEHKDENESNPTQEHPPQDGRIVDDSAEEDQDKEGTMDKCMPFSLSLTIFILLIFNYYLVIICSSFAGV